MPAMPNNVSPDAVSAKNESHAQQKIPLQKLYEDLANIDKMDLTASAQCRERAQQVLANTKISLNWRDAIAERLHEANHTLAIKTVTGDDSY